MKIEPVYRLLLPPSEKVRIIQVGVGGTGSHLATALGQLVYAAGERGVEVEVILVDDDIVEKKNVGRQLFCLAEIGLSKAEAMAWRLNSALGVEIGALREKFSEDVYHRLERFEGRQGGDVLLVGCVDNHDARVEMAGCVERCGGRLWWLDCGNAEYNGHVRIGNMGEGKRWAWPTLEMGVLEGLPAPHVQERALLEPEPIREPMIEEDVRSCAGMMMAGEQSLMVNRTVAAIAASVIVGFVLERELYSGATLFNTRPYVSVSHGLTRRWLEEMGCPPE